MYDSYNPNFANKMSFPAQTMMQNHPMMASGIGQSQLSNSFLFQPSVPTYKPVSVPVVETGYRARTTQNQNSQQMYTDPVMQ